jgi:hypothetical protein
MIPTLPPAATVLAVLIVLCVACVISVAAGLVVQRVFHEPLAPRPVDFIVGPAVAMALMFWPRVTRVFGTYPLTWGLLFIPLVVSAAHLLSRGLGKARFGGRFRRMGGGN